MLQLDDGLVEELRTKYDPIQVAIICKFLLPFSKNGKIYSVRLLMRAGTLKKRIPFPELMKLLYEQYDVWKTNPKRIADTDDIEGGNGERNTLAFFTIYKQLGMDPKGLY